MHSDRPRTTGARTASGLHRKILIIEDHDETRELYAHHFAKAGYDVETARNGNEGIGAALTMKPDVVILDLAMPVLDGWETVKVLRSYITAWTLPIIACTAVESDDALARAAALGCTALVRKPCVADDIERAVRRALERLEIVG